jgi:PAS domain S-box-containing protein
MSEPAQTTILVVEDDQGLAALAQRSLSRASHAVRLAASADEALQLLRRHPVDLVVVDAAGQAVVDGLAFHTRMKAARFDRPVILVIPSGNEVAIVEALHAGVRDFVTKSPEQIEYLPPAVERVLKQVRTERQLAESEARLAGIIASARDAILVAEADERITLFNAAAEQMFRCQAAQALGQPLRRFIPKEYVSAEGVPLGEGGPASGASLTYHLRTGTRGVRANGEVFPLEASVSPVEVHGRKFYTVVVRDVTDRRKAEQALRESEQRFRTLADQAPVLIWMAGPDGHRTFFNQRWLRFTGRPLQREQGMGWAEGLHPDDAPLYLAAYADALRNHREFTLEYRLRSADGSYRWLLADVVPRQADGNFAGLIGCAVDITARKQAEDALRESEERFKTLMDNSPAVAFVKDPEGRYVYLSSPFERFLGRPAAAQLGKTDNELWPEDIARTFREHDLAALTSGKVLEVEETAPANDGSLTHWLSFKFPFEDRFNRRFLGGVAINVTAHKRVEEQLRHSQKMEAMGKVVGGVAHDFNNLLTVINGYCDLLLLRLAREDPARDLVREIAKAGQRASALTHQLLAFSRKQVLRPQVLDLNALIRESEKMFRRLIGENIDLTSSLAPGLGGVRADPGQVEQVLLNLVVNARDAMPQGGRLTVETRKVREVLDAGSEQRT